MTNPAEAGFRVVLKTGVWTLGVYTALHKATGNDPLRHFPPNYPKQRRHSLLLPPLSRRRWLVLTLLRLLVTVVLELLLANRLLGFFRGHGGRGLPVRPASVVAAARLALARLR